MAGPLQRLLPQVWQQRGLGAWLLAPLALLYAGIWNLRKHLYGRGLLRSYHPNALVVVVGNVVVGGAGKTPVVMAVVEHLRSRGWRPGVVSRGYGRESTACVEVVSASKAAEVGDEPLLIHSRTGVPVFVASDRVGACRALLSKHAEVNLIVCDDGLQHLQLRRDLEVVVFDDRGIGNGWLLPAGLLREPWPRQADFVLSPNLANGATHLISRRLDRQARNHAGEHCSLEELRRRPVVAVAGTARPESFFRMLEEEGLTLDQVRALPDHWSFPQPLEDLPTGCALVCTEKDAPKLWRHHPHAWAVPLVIEIEAGFFLAMEERLGAKLSSLQTTSRDSAHGQ